ncbi:FtsW/RodA/SpoVE family cell cycle protein [Dictyobacter arantiisoli]|uniref:Cell cycle protein n=1 Tax=Dictyobacter arantiisoli TaxID=2014874 RepID=A0A5A5T7R2_9CHLR|nr:FtsW/RodA/SpoVE family cell cycle protein [Dictyobacter arantiisoli]GCF07053.1 cell cycle protein [Dictyobacter arantiisoli]
MAQIAQRTTGVVRQFRWKELSLLIVPALILLLLMTQLLIIRASNDPAITLDNLSKIKNLPILDGLIPLLGFLAAVLGVHIVLNIFFRKADQVLLPLVALLSGLGILMMTRLGPDILKIHGGPIPNLGSHQLLWVILGLAICLATMFILRNVNWLARYKYTWMLFCFAVLLPSVIKGITTIKSGAPTRDTLGIGALALQPSEFLKIGVVIFFAGYLNDNRDVLAEGSYRLGPLRLPPLRQLGPMLFMLAIGLLSFLIVRELGLAMLVYSLFLCMTYVGTGKKSYAIVSLLAFVMLAFIGYSLLTYVQARFAALAFNPTNWANFTPAQENFYQNNGGGFQIVQGLVNVASGGILGSGFGMGYPVTPPVIDADMAFTAYAEEFGLVGLFAIIGIYLLIVHRGFRIATEANDIFSKLLATGLTSVFALQTIIIAAANLKLFPLTGIPLPYLSNGGNAILANFIIVGILLRISHNTAVEREGAF